MRGAQLTITFIVGFIAVLRQYDVTCLTIATEKFLLLISCIIQNLQLGVSLSKRHHFTQSLDALFSLPSGCHPVQVIMNRPSRKHTAYPGLLELDHSHSLQDLHIGTKWNSTP